ncbi:MAG TPA: hypothetical protein VGL72_06575 [Bryobacteraceae bacterium]|jgi:hypothetical protein
MLKALKSQRKLPHLTPEEITDRDLQERRFHQQLSACRGGYDFDIERGYQVIRSFTVELFETIFSAYRKKIGYDPKWIPEITNEAVYRSLIVIQDKAESEFRDVKEIAIVLEETIAEHLETSKGDPVQTAAGSASVPAERPNLGDRLALKNSYRAAFPDVKLADIFWAAGQTRREWKRWINGESKDGLKPDRCFRKVLTSGKKPEEIVGKPRPTKYNV